MEDIDLQVIKKQYLDTPIPEELGSIIEKALKDGIAYRTKKEKIYKRINIAAISIAVFLALLTIGINTSPAFASLLSKVPIVQDVSKVLNFRIYILNKDRFKADIKIPRKEGFRNKELENSLNEKYLEENKKLYKEFMAEIEKIKEIDGPNLGVVSGYVVKTDTDRILSIGRYVLNVAGSATTKFKYDTIDKKEEILITLPSLFKDDSYIDVISENIKSQMIERMKSDENLIYWVNMDGNEEYTDVFEKISANQNFYINEKGKLVISFDEYEVAPGLMGIQEFVIPTEAISDILVSNVYIK
ncbi:MAG TPA: DUF3298 and DUF4163 domain-containing protein [Clostridiaceae bacterium]|nr:DUF3298 and DUF4163 domain-containing protein [Clostridiaceae bacterium]